jgi:hypothetical protein
MMFVKNNQAEFSEDSQTMMEIFGKKLVDDGSSQSLSDVVLRFSLSSNSEDNTRAKISCKISIAGGSFIDYNNITYYWNGNLVAFPEMTANEWGVLSISFQEFLVFNESPGRLDIKNSVLVDNLANYKISETESASSTTINTWNTAKFGSETWEKVMDTDGFETPTNDPDDDNSWFNTYAVIEKSLKPVDQTDIYRTYLGTNKIIVDTTDSETPKAFKVNNCQYVVYNTTEWKTNTLNPI